MKRAFNPEELSATAHRQEAVTVMKSIGLERQPVHHTSPTIYDIRQHRRKI